MDYENMSENVKTYSLFSDKYNYLTAFWSDITCQNYIILNNEDWMFVSGYI